MKPVPVLLRSRAATKAARHAVVLSCLVALVTGGCNCDSVTKPPKSNDTLVVVTPSDVRTTEAGSQIEVSVALASRPLHDVVVPVASSDATEGTVSTTSLTFTPANWNAPQTVTVTGVDDDVEDGDQTYRIEFGPTTSDRRRASRISRRRRRPHEHRQRGPGVMLGLAERRHARRRWHGHVHRGPDVAADRRRDRRALVERRHDRGHGLARQLTFTAANWNTPQTVTVTGVDDALDDGDSRYTIVDRGGDERRRELQRRSTPPTSRCHEHRQRRRRASRSPRSPADHDARPAARRPSPSSLDSQPTADVTVPTLVERHDRGHGLAARR